MLQMNFGGGAFLRDGHGRHARVADSSYDPWRARGGSYRGSYRRATPSLRRSPGSVRPARSTGKRVLDILGAASILIALLPVMIVLVVLVRLDGGPAFFRQSRVGAGGRQFGCLKFRSMCVDAEQRLNYLLAHDPEAREEWERDFKLRDDPRITRIGQIMRRTSLDELPQLFNVLRGDMSLVGPRPIVRAEMARYQNAIRDYMLCRPGLTGLWQVSGRNDVDYATRVDLDCRYARSWTIIGDVRILFRTVGVVLKGSGAY